MRVHVLSLLASAALLAGDRDDLPFLVAALDSPDPAVAADAQGRLLLIGPDSLPLLRSAAEDELARRAELLPRVARLVRDLDADDYDVRERSQLDLVEIGPEALPALREAAAHGTPEQQARAQAAVDRIGAGAAVPPRFLVSLAHALAAQPNDLCVPALTALARQPEVPIMADAVEGLWRLGSEAAIAALRTLAGDAHPDRRWLGRAALLASGVDIEATSAQFVADWPSEPTRSIVYAALRRWESPNVVRFALMALEREGVSAPAALLTVLDEVVDAPLLTSEALSRLRSGIGPSRGPLVGLLRTPSDEALAAAVAALGDAEWRAREAAVAALARLQGAEASQLIEPLLADPELPVRLAALRALHSVGGADPSPFLAALRAPDESDEAVEFALVRMSGAGRLGTVGDPAGGPTDEECASIDRWLLEAMDPRFLPALQQIEPGALPMWHGEFRNYLLTAAHRLQGPLPPRPIETFGPAARFRELLDLDSRGRIDSIRAGLREPEGSARAEAARWAVWGGLGGFEDDVFPLLTCGDRTTEDFARMYLRRWRNDDLASRVRRSALGSDPGAAALLWVQWEGRTAARDLLDRLKEPGQPPRGLLPALAQAPLEPSDAPILLALTVRERDDVRGMCSALRRTGSADAQARLREMATLVVSPSEDAWDELAGDPSELGYVLRTLRARRGLVGDALPRAIATYRAATSPSAFGELAARVAVTDWHVVESLSRAMVRCDIEAARGKAAEWRRSIHAPSRLASLWIGLLSGEPPSRGEAEALSTAGAHTRLALLRLARGSGRVPLLQACLPFLTDPDPSVRVQARQGIASGLGAAPEGHANGFSVPTEARRAWEEWFVRNPDLVRGRELARWRSAPEATSEAEGLLQAFVRGPSHVAMAAWIERASCAEELPDDPQALVDEAVRWRDSLR